MWIIIIKKIKKEDGFVEAKNEHVNKVTCLFLWGFFLFIVKGDVWSNWPSTSYNSAEAGLLQWGICWGVGWSADTDCLSWVEFLSFSQQRSKLLKTASRVKEDNVIKTKGLKGDKNLMYVFTFLRDRNQSVTSGAVVWRLWSVHYSWRRMLTSPCWTCTRWPPITTTPM